VRFKGSSPTRPSPAQKDKIRRELGVVQGNLTVLNEVLSEKGGNEEEEFLQLLTSTLKEMQSRLGALLTQIDPTDESDLISELLGVNDELNNGFLRYTRFVKNKEKSARTPQLTESSLIDFSVESTIEGGAVPKRRQVEWEESSVLETHSESDFQEMEAWLREGGFIASQQEPTPPLSSSEFDRFLEERAKK